MIGKVHVGMAGKISKNKTRTAFGMKVVGELFRTIVNAMEGIQQMKKDTHMIATVLVRAASFFRPCILVKDTSAVISETLLFFLCLCPPNAASGRNIFCRVIKYNTAIIMIGRMKARTPNTMA